MDSMRRHGDPWPNAGGICPQRVERRLGACPGSNADYGSNLLIPGDGGKVRKRRNFAVRPRFGEGQKSIPFGRTAISRLTA